MKFSSITISKISMLQIPVIEFSNKRGIYNK